MVKDSAGVVSFWVRTIFKNLGFKIELYVMRVNVGLAEVCTLRVLLLHMYSPHFSLVLILTGSRVFISVSLTRSKSSFCTFHSLSLKFNLSS